jgi:hypothetical protein
MILTLYGRPISTFFDLLGIKENGLTYSLGWGLATVPPIAERLMAEVFGESVGEVTGVSLQDFGPDRGYTDIELRAASHHLLVEAKRGWVLSSIAQLQVYAPRVAPKGSAILVLAECSPVFARRHLPRSIGGIRVFYRSWRQVLDTVEAVREGVSHRERQLLRDLARYLKGVVTMQDLASNWTYCVSLSQAIPNGWPCSTVDFVVQRNTYFCPYAARGWPKTPPNYLAFRWRGHVQDVRHVESYQVVQELEEAIPGIPKQRHPFLQIVFTLGPRIPPSAPLPNGAQYRATRIWVSLDLILTEATLREALAKGRRRAEARLEPG